MRSLTFLIFVIVTICCWGVYGPVLHIGQEEMGVPPIKSSLRPFICVGIAYFLIAVLFPIFVLYTKGEKGNWSPTGIFWSFFAGLVGAIGALGIILAFKFNGKPFYVMPLVFGLAPVVNTFTSMIMARTIRNASTIFYVGVLIVAVGAAGVMFFKPAPPKKVKGDTPATKEVETTDVSFVQESEGDNADQETGTQDGDETTTENESEEGLAETSSETNVADSEADKPADSETGNMLWVALAIAMTALCWGAYGPVLHKGQAKMGGSRLRPFLCVGLAYFVIAVIAPLFMMPVFDEPGGWPVVGISWSMLAGAAGAVGALGIIYAFNTGGKPVFIMPLVFGFAPVVNTATEIASKNLFGQVKMGFWVSLIMVICGAVIVLTCAPKGKPPAKKVEEDK